MPMSRVADPAQLIAWLAERSDSDGALTGYHAEGWDADTWILHAAYKHPGTDYSGTHDDLEKAAIAAGLLEPTVIGDVDLSAEATATGISLGFVERPPAPWRRIRWAEMLGWTSMVIAEPFAPSFRWFPTDSLPATISGMPEGSMDAASFEGLVEVLARSSAGGLDAICFALWAELPTWSPDGPQIWRGRLRDVWDLFGAEDTERQYTFSPTNLWPEDRSWFVCTDYDLSATHLSGDERLISAVINHPDIEAITWRSADSQ